jgi:hypothetical protein
MKKIIIVTLTIIMVLFSLSACKMERPKETVDTTPPTQLDASNIDSLKTFEDVINLTKEETQSSVGNGYVVYAFKFGDDYYRVYSAISKELEDEYINIDITDEDAQEKQEALIKDIEVDKVEKLTDQILTEEQCNELVGKTGKDLVTDGWTYDGSYMLDEMEIWMAKGPFVYAVTFDGTVPESEYEDFDCEKDTKDMKVKAVRFEMLGDVSNIE